MTTTTYHLTYEDGSPLGIVASLAAAAALVAANPGATVKPVVTVDAPCKLHPAYAADYCTPCGTAVVIGGTR